MHRKDYQAFAKQLASALANPTFYYHNSAKSDYENGIKSATVAIAIYLQADNPKFDKAQFFKACGIRD